MRCALFFLLTEISLREGCPRHRNNFRPSLAIMPVILLIKVLKSVETIKSSFLGTFISFFALKIRWCEASIAKLCLLSLSGQAFGSIEMSSEEDPRCWCSCSCLSLESSFRFSICRKSTYILNATQMSLPPSILPWHSSHLRGGDADKLRTPTRKESCSVFTPAAPGTVSDRAGVEWTA